MRVESPVAARRLVSPTTEEALYDIQSMRGSATGAGPRSDPDETTILNFRHLLEAHGLTKAVFKAVADHLEAHGALLRGGTIVDATLIAASSSTKNAAGQPRRLLRNGSRTKIPRTKFCNS